MSLWLQSLDSCFYDNRGDLGDKARCILAHLSMTVPRSWWEHALDTGSLPDSYVSILKGLRNELLEILEFPNQLEFGLLVALAFADEHGEDRELKYGTVDSHCSIEEYLSKANEILKRHIELRELGEKISEKAKLLT
jgi:hypothetical protein